jgi:hypothetical protein
MKQAIQVELSGRKCLVARSATPGCTVETGAGSPGLSRAKSRLAQTSLTSARIEASSRQTLVPVRLVQAED